MPRPFRLPSCCSTFFNYSNVVEHRVFFLSYIMLRNGKINRLVDYYTAINQVSVGCWFQKMGSVHGEELPFVFGAPLVDGFGHFPRNYTRSEVALSESIVQFFANFVRTGWVEIDNWSTLPFILLFLRNVKLDNQVRFTFFFLADQHFSSTFFGYRQVSTENSNLDQTKLKLFLINIMIRSLHPFLMDISTRLRSNNALQILF